MSNWLPWVAMAMAGGLVAAQMLVFRSLLKGLRETIERHRTYGPVTLQELLAVSQNISAIRAALERGFEVGRAAEVPEAPPSPFPALDRVLHEEMMNLGAGRVGELEKRLHRAPGHEVPEALKRLQAAGIVYCDGSKRWRLVGKAGADG